MSTMADRIRIALDERGMTPSDLIRLKVLSKAGVYFLLDGTTKAETVRADTISKLCKALSVNRDWLLTGRGEKNSPPGFTESSPTSQVQRIDPDMLSQAMRLIEMIDEFRETPAPTETFPARLSIAYMVVAEEIATQGEGNVVHMDTARRLAARLRQENADKDDDGNKRGQATRAGV